MPHLHPKNRSIFQNDDRKEKVERRKKKKKEGEKGKVVPKQNENVVAP